LLGGGSNGSRALSFVIVALIYIVSTIGALLIYPLLPLPWWASLLIVDILATIFVFLFSLLFENASVYDPYWSVQPVVILVGLAMFSQLDALKIVLLCAVCLWGIRLTANWAYTFKGLNFQDWRYTMLKESTGVFYPIINFIGIHMVPTLIVYACTMPAVFIIAEKPALNYYALVFLTLSLIAITLQFVADVQMHMYRENRTTPFIRTGLWKYSRHPNYLGEILMWWGIGLCSIFLMPDKWWMLTGAVVNTILFLSVSIPMADKRQSKKEGFKEYKAQTRMLLPIKK
jgi:steroid 5-alpha reductase family enzyme